MVDASAIEQEAMNGRAQAEFHRRAGRDLAEGLYKTPRRCSRSSAFSIPPQHSSFATAVLLTGLYPDLGFH